MPTRKAQSSFNQKSLLRCNMHKRDEYTCKAGNKVRIDWLGRDGRNTASATTPHANSSVAPPIPPRDSPVAPPTRSSAAAAVSPCISGQDRAENGERKERKRRANILGIIQNEQSIHVACTRVGTSAAGAVKKRAPHHRPHPTPLPDRRRRGPSDTYRSPFTSGGGGELLFPFPFS